jgi:hypothetical protein
MGREAELQPLLAAFVRYVEAIQRTDGSFDQCYPFERTPGVVLDILPALLRVRSMAVLDEQSRAILEKVIAAAAAYTAQSDEKHGEIANHLASFADALLALDHAIGHPMARRKGMEYLQRTLQLFDHEEGWFQEYRGPDAGYQSRCLAFLTRIANLENDDALWEVCGRAARFIETMMMPDGSLHPMMGVRSTALLYPSGFERLAARDPAFLPLACRVRKAWATGVVPLPSWLDFDNALRLADDAREAAEIAEAAGTADADLATELPEGVVELPRAGLIVSRSPTLTMHLAWRLGGAVAIYRRQADRTWQLAYESAGYLVDAGDRGRWLTRMPGAGTLSARQTGMIEVQSHFYRSLHDELTPTKLILLRVLNLTVLRSQFIGDIFRKLVVKRLIAGDEPPAPLSFTRTITFTTDQVEIADCINAHGTVPEWLTRGTLLACRRMTGAHMASSRYFQPQEVEPAAGSWVQNVPGGLDNAAVRVVRAVPTS